MNKIYLVKKLGGFVVNLGYVEIVQMLNVLIDGEKECWPHENY